VHPGTTVQGKRPPSRWGRRRSGSGSPLPGHPGRPAGLVVDLQKKIFFIKPCNFLAKYFFIIRIARALKALGSANAQRRKGALLAWRRGGVAG
jgi:hypothetical protein